jgi:hypothetical protein
LHEISAVRRGAVAHAFAMLVDGISTEAPRCGQKSALFRTAYAFHKTGVALRALHDSVRRLNDRMTRGSAVHDQ